MKLEDMRYRLVGLALVLFCGTAWAWMLGAFAQLATIEVDKNAAQWIAPGVLSFPGTVATIAGLVGLLLLLGIIPLSRKNETKC